MSLSPVTLYGREAASVFDLLGHTEVDLTAALGWTLTRSPALMAALWSRLGMPGDSAEVSADLEVAGTDGRTDLELIGTEATVIVEAKKGWLVPGESQLAGYAPRLAGLKSRLLVSLSDSSEMWAGYQLPETVDGVLVVHLAWDSVRADLKAAYASTRSPVERVWLDELGTYLAGATAVRDPSEQWVYCVVVSNDKPGGGANTFRDFVQRERVYFHPYGGKAGWPKRPPTFMAFRWGGVVRQINRVLSHEVVPTLNSRWPDIPRSDPENNNPHIVYELGPDIPSPTLSTKGTFANARVWALLDQMLTQPSLQDAARASKAIAPV